MTPKKIIIVCPAKNEAKVIGNTLQQLIAHGFDQIVVVDDGSTDDTVAVCKTLPVHIVSHLFNCGAGAAIQTGTEYALQLEADIIVYFDADGQHDPGDIAPLVTPILDNQVDIVFGSRFLGTVHGIGWAKRMVLMVGKWLNAIFVGVLLDDPYNGLRALSKTAAEKIVIRENGFSFPTDIIEQVGRLRLRYKEVPITVKYTDYSKVKGQPLWNAVLIFFKMIVIMIRRH